MKGYWPAGNVWRHRNFLRLWAAQATSAVGSRITRTALPVLAIVTVGGSTVQIATLSALSVGPGAIVGLLAGGRIDRAAKRPILIAADLVRGLLVLTLPVTAWLGELTLYHLYVVGALVGCASALFQLTDNAYLPALIGKEHLVAANTKIEATESTAEIVGPGIAGLLIEWLTAPVAVLIDSISYFASALFLGAIDSHEQPAAPSGEDSVLSDIRLGFGAVLREPLIRPLLFASAVMTLSWGFFLALYMVYVLDVLHLSVGIVGGIICVGGLGGLFGAALSSRTATAVGTGRAMILCSFLGMAGSLFIPLASGSTVVIVALLVCHQLLGDGFLVAYEIQAISLRQTCLPLNLLARANSVFTAVHALLLPAGAMLAGVLGDWLGVRTTIALGVGFGLLTPLTLLSLRNLRTLPKAGATAPA